MKRGTMPEVCSSCRKMKLPNLGEYKAAFRYNTWRFTCHECLGKPKVQRLNRRNNETPPEREARMWLQQNKIQASAEFKLGSFIYDFAVPKLGLLIELDSRRYHTNTRHRLRDSHKDKSAVGYGWTVKRIRIGPHMLLDLEKCLHEQRASVGIE
jgi:very-short-patch-repair endonuclease